MGSGFPDVLAPVTLQLDLPDGARAELPSRVCDVEEGDDVTCIVVSRPDLSGLAEPGTFPRDGEAPMLLWPQTAGAMQCRVGAEAAIRPYGPVWVLTPISEPSLEQRREVFPTPPSPPAVLTVLGDETAGDEPAVHANLIDISEGGTVICCDGALPDVGAHVRLSFSLDDKAVTADAEVLRHLALPTGRPSAALRFLNPAG